MVAKGVIEEINTIEETTRNNWPLAVVEESFL
jgi:hypothetical protein